MVLPEDEVLALEVLGVGTQVTDGPLDALLALEGVEVDVEDSLELVMQLLHDGRFMRLGGERPAVGEGEGEGRQDDQDAADDEQRQDDGGEHIKATVGDISGAILGNGVIVVVKVALGAALLVGRGGGGGVR